MKRRDFLQSALVLALVGCGDDGVTGRLVARGSTVLALGDSLTAGFGAGQGEDYPSVLAQKTGWRVVNGGVSGDTSAQALARLPALLEEHQPRLVIIGIGGNDFLRRLPEGETESNVNQIMELVKASGAQMVLVGIPAANVGAALGVPSDHPLYAQLAEKHQSALFSSAWGDVLSEAKWRSDQVHANAAGYAEFADRLYRFLKKRKFVK